jgi:ABC-type lipoprotein export system ATPase subunit
MVRLEQILKTYRSAQGNVKALDGVNLHIEKGEFVVICGPSGSGKTTLLMTIAAMLRPTSGKVSIDGRSLYGMDQRGRATFRAQNIGFVFQDFALIPYLNVMENVAFAGGAAANGRRDARARALIEKFGLTARAHHKPSQLSAGEKQRTAVARALLNNPRIVLADEPTGNLDPDNAAVVLRDFTDFNGSGGTVIVATHGLTAEKFASRIIYLQDGKIRP